MDDLLGLLVSFHSDTGRVRPTVKNSDIVENSSQGDTGRVSPTNDVVENPLQDYTGRVSPSSGGGDTRRVSPTHNVAGNLHRITQGVLVLLGVLDCGRLGVS